MRAVNLIPAEQRRGAGGAAGRSGGSVFVVLGLLAGLVLLAGLYAMAHQQVSDRKAQIAGLSVRAARAQAQTNALTSYASFLTIRDQRVQTIEGLAAQRFDWPHAFHEVGRVLPYDVALTDLTGVMGSSTSGPPAPVTPGSAAQGGTPTIEIGGCAVSNSVVAQTLVRLRGIDGVTDVSLETSDKAQAAAIGGGASVASSDCRQGHPNYPLFKIKVTFAAVPAAPSASAAPRTGTSSGATATSSATSASGTPAATPASTGGVTPASTPASSTAATPPPASAPASSPATPAGTAPAAGAAATNPGARVTR